MIELKKACEIVLKAHPYEYIFHINEYQKFYQFFLQNKGEPVTVNTFVIDTPAVNKYTGELLDKATMIDNIFNGDYKYADVPDLEA